MFPPPQGFTSVAKSQSSHSPWALFLREANDKCVRLFDQTQTGLNKQNSRCRPICMLRTLFLITLKSNNFILMIDVSRKLSYRSDCCIIYLLPTQNCTFIFLLSIFFKNCIVDHNVHKLVVFVEVCQLIKEFQFSSFQFTLKKP